jgi:molybdopterin-dependent oxidoreductase-like protein protein
VSEGFRGFVSRGFGGRRSRAEGDDRLPPGQYETSGFPVLSAGPTPRTPLEEWDFSIVGEVDEPKRWTWEEFRALPSEEITRDIHCVTKWSKFDTRWEGVSVDTLLEGVENSAEYITAFCDGGYTTNLPLEDVTGGKAWVAFAYDGEPLEPEHGGPAPARAAPLLLEEREVGAGPAAHRLRHTRLLGVARLPRVRRPVARAALLGRLRWRPDAQGSPGA